MERVSVTDDFFDLGGNSIIAIRLLNRIREALDLQLPLSRLLTATTVAGLAEAIEQMLLEKLEGMATAETQS